MITIAAVRAMTNPVDLTFAAEELGCADHGEEARTLLLELVAHKSPLVREGAVYGLTCHVQHENVRAVLLKLVDGDPNPGVRVAADEVLNG